jgi:hypothetical protein
MLSVIMLDVIMLSIVSRVCSSLTCKHSARLERLARDKHFGLLRKYVNYGSKRFHSTGPRAQCYKTFYGRNLRIFVISYSVCPWQTFPAQSNVCL